MKLLIDTNVLLDMVLKRNGYDISVELFRKIREQEVPACITASSVTDLFYINRKETHDTERTYVIMENIFCLVTVLSVTEKDIRDAFGHKLLSVKLDAPAPCRLDVPDLDFACRAPADCLHQHLQVI